MEDLLSEKFIRLSTINPEFKVRIHLENLCEVDYRGDIYFVSPNRELHKESRHNLLVVLISLLVDMGDIDWTVERALDKLIYSNRDTTT